jgi:hypothetical protein
VSAPQLARIIGRGGAQINTIRQNCGIRMETIDLPGDERMVCVFLLRLMDWRFVVHGEFFTLCELGIRFQVVLIGSLRGINDGIGMIVRCLEDPIHEVEPFRMTVLVPSDKVRSALCLSAEYSDARMAHVC